MSDTTTPAIEAPILSKPTMSFDRMLELVGILGQRGCEIGQETSKVRRFGLDTVNPICPQKLTPRDRLEHKLGDILCVMNLLCAGGVLDVSRITQRAKDKLPKLLSTLVSAP